MDAQMALLEAHKAKIEIKGSLEELQRISIFLENNFIKYDLVEDQDAHAPIGEWEDPIDWPLEGFLGDTD